MVFDAIVEALAGLLTWLAGLLPTGSVPAWFASTSASLNTWLGLTAGLGAWMPVGLMLQVFAAFLLSLVAGFAIRLVRIIASFLTAGGGSAG